MAQNILIGVLVIGVGIIFIALRQFIVSYNRRIGTRMYGRLGEKTMSALTVPLVVSVGVAFIVFGFVLVVVGSIQLLAA